MSHFDFTVVYYWKNLLQGIFKESRARVDIHCKRWGKDSSSNPFKLTGRLGPAPALEEIALQKGSKQETNLRPDDEDTVTMTNMTSICRWPFRFSFKPAFVVGRRPPTKGGELPPQGIKVSAASLAQDALMVNIKWRLPCEDDIPSEKGSVKQNVLVRFRIVNPPPPHQLLSNSLRKLLVAEANQPCGKSYKQVMWQGRKERSRMIRKQ